MLPFLRLAGRAAVLLALCISARASVKLPDLFGSNMVLQQDASLRIWGHADPGEPITVVLSGGGQTREGKTTTTPDGTWQIDLARLAATPSTFGLTVRGSDSEHVFKNILIGDVWVCSGQSNMAFLLTASAEAATELPQFRLPSVRLFRVTPAVSFEPSDEVHGQWVECTPETAAKFSAVACYFAKELAAHRATPIGLIGTYWGGTPAQAWMSSEALASNPRFSSHLARKNQIVTTLDALRKRYRTADLPKWEAEMKAWEELKAREPGSPTTAPRKPTSPDQNPGVPTVLYNAMVRPLADYSVKGILWYQGESNAKTAAEADDYGELFPALIRDWRALWQRDDLPFLFVQLPGYGEGQFWPQLRSAQTKALALPATGMAVAIDLGERDNIHPKAKKEIGRRLALVARSVVHGETVAASGPAPESARSASDGSVRIRFKPTKTGLVLRAESSSGFELAGPDGHYVAAQAFVEGDTLVVRSPEVLDPHRVRYAWAPFPATPLHDTSGLPAAPFDLPVGQK